MSKKEFWLGIAIITFCVGFWSLVEPPVTVSTAKVKVVKIEEVGCKTDEEGNVEVYEK